MEAGPRFKACAEIQSLASRATLRRALRSFRPNEVPLRCTPDCAKCANSPCLNLGGQSNK